MPDQNLKTKDMTILEYVEMDNPPTAFFDMVSDCPDPRLTEIFKSQMPFYPYTIVTNVKRLDNHYYSINGMGVSSNFIVQIEDK